MKEVNECDEVGHSDWTIEPRQMACSQTEKSAEGLYRGAANGNERFFVNLFRVKGEGVEYKNRPFIFCCFFGTFSYKDVLIKFKLNQAICARTGTNFLPQPVFQLFKNELSIRTILKRTLFRVKWYLQDVL